MPRNKHEVWNKFECIASKNSGNWARCKMCKKEMQGIPSRMEKHVQRCGKNSTEESIDNTVQNIESIASTSKEDVCVVLPTAKKQKKLSIVSDSNIITTSDEYSIKINKQIARYFYATNTPFNHADHSELIKMCSILRPSYKGPSGKQIGGPILDTVHKEVKTKCRGEIKNCTVCMSMDGWSNIHNEPLICCNIVTSNSESILVDCVDTGVDRHTAENLKDLAIKAIKIAQDDFQVRVGSFVTDNAANVQKMRLDLLNGVDVIQYGCSAHILNLLAQDLEIPEATQAIIKVIKYFRNKHVPGALFKEARGKKLVMPQEVRWNTISDAIKSYLHNRGILVQICQDNKEEIDNEIVKIVNDSHVSMNATDLLARLTPIAVALDRMQRASTISVAVEIWNKLEIDLKDQPLEIKKHFYKRRSMALGGAHFVANMLDHRFLGQRLNNKQKEEAYAFIVSINNEFLPFVMALTSTSLPFPKYMFGPHFRKTRPIVWWKSLCLTEWPIEKENFLKFCDTLLTATASTASLERYFSTFGLVHSKLRNRLGRDKAAKLVFLFKYLNREHSVATNVCNIEWIWDEATAPAQEIASLDSSDDDPLINLLK